MTVAVARPRTAPAIPSPRSPVTAPLPAAAAPTPPAGRAVDSQRVLHQLVRRELRLLAELSEWAPAEDAGRTGALTRHAELLGRVLLHHHAVERDRLWPALRRRLPEDPELVGQFTAALADWTDRCARIDHMLRDVATAARQWAVAGTRRARDAFAVACRDLAGSVEAQLAEEERTLLPLVAAWLDPADWAGIARGRCGGFTARERLLVLGLALEDACAADRARLLAGVGRSTRLVWRAAGRGRYRAAVVRLRGEPPAV